MVRRALLATAATALCAAALVTAQTRPTILPSGWRLSAPAALLAATGTMPQGFALSPDGTQLAVVESGLNPPALRVLDTKMLHETALVKLPGAFGEPVWADATHLYVAGANTDAVLEVDLATNRVVARIPIGKGTWPAAVALSTDGKELAVSDDGNATVTTVTLAGRATHVYRVGPHPAGLRFDAGGTLYVADRGDSNVVVLNQDGTQTRIPVGLHPSALALSADGSRLYVAESDDDSVGVIDTRAGKRIADINIGLRDGRLYGYGASPNAIAVTNEAVYVSLGAENAVAQIAGGKVVARIPVGWYPTDVAVDGQTLYVADGKGEGTRANPQYNPFLPHHSAGYVAATLFGSIRTVDLPRLDAQAATAAAIADAMPTWQWPAHTVIRANGPIRHVIYVIKENRSYDQVLGDVAGANGDPHLVWFGEKITPNQHALARRFGVLDNAYTNSQVSADGHNWTDAAFANDYLERFWPPNYGGRRDLYDFQSGTSPVVPHNGYLWDDAKRAGITYRDYGEDTNAPSRPGRLVTTDFPGLQGHYDPRYYGWDLDYSDLARYREWKREFDGFVAHNDLPRLEIVYLPNDHTSGTRAGSLTPQAYVATNDDAVGKLVDAVSHSQYWKSTAIFIVEDDAQDGPDHVSNQRSTFYIASPYARGGVYHEHYSTASVVHTVELLCGLQPLSIYDRTALPLFAEFTQTASNARPFEAIAPRIDIHTTNARTAYGAAISARLDFSQPDRVDPRLFNDILAHAVQARRFK